METIFYSAKTNSAYPESLKGEYMQAGSWPDDAMEISGAIYTEFFMSHPPDGKVRMADESGLPLWGDIPLPTPEELKVIANAKKQSLMDAANSHINAYQWPSKLALGRLNDADKGKFNRWLDYLDALNAIDTSLVPDIEWPTTPE
ncbi:tail fiber assembly protein [Limnobaculum zhutongyuii]|uniref:Tail fiber assembly protein n=2 Tax=Limnobaculum zhutongyuii TaxID=2498113 RepID=A0A411WRH1_9GAMM|nr:tail fiber assembly protein [Limnobaculum zhutongyuii]TQS90525.1 tail fiber assembly protein [Limnobaculum zhutongyuii]